MPPVELPVDAIAAATRGRAVAAEVFAFGRLPLAMSARCFTARHYGLNRDECEFRCMEQPDGLLLKNTLDAIGPLVPQVLARRA